MIDSSTPISVKPSEKQYVVEQRIVRFIKPPVPRWEWLTVLFVFCMLSRAVFTLLLGGPTGYSPTADMLKMITNVICLCLVIMWAKSIALNIIRLAPLVFFLSYTMITPLWSSNVTEAISQSIEFILATLVGIYLVERFTYREFMQLLAMYFLILLVANYFFVFFLPDLGTAEYGDIIWLGAIGNRNATAAQMAAGAYIYFMRYVLSDSRSAKLYNLGMIAAFVVFLLKTGNATSLIAMITMFMLTPLINTACKPNKGVIYFPIILFMIIVLTIIAAILLTNLEVVLNLLGKDITLTGRTEVWSITLRQFWQYPVFGDAKEVYVELGNGEYLGTAHNMSLEILARYGIVGFILFASFYIHMIVKAFIFLKKQGSIQAIWPISYIITISIMGLAEAALLATFFWTLLICAYAAEGRWRLQN